MDRIRQLRMKRGLSQAKLAVMADMDPATLNRLERGTGNPNLKTLQRIADALDISVAELLEDASPKAQAPLFQELPDSATQEDRRPPDITVRMAAAELSAEGKPLTITVKREQVLRVLHEQGMSAEKADATWRELERLSA